MYNFTATRLAKLDFFFFFTVYLHACLVCYFHLCDQTTPPSEGRGLDFISRMSMSPVWRRLGHIYSVSPPVIFPLYSHRRQIKERRRRENCIWRESVSRGRVAAVDSPWDRSSPSLSAKYLITPADTRRAGGNAAQNESPALGEGAAAAAGSSLKTGLLFKVFHEAIGSSVNFAPKWWWEHVEGK